MDGVPNVFAYIQFYYGPSYIAQQCAVGNGLLGCAYDLDVIYPRSEQVRTNENGKLEFRDVSCPQQPGKYVAVILVNSIPSDAHEIDCVGPEISVFNATAPDSIKTSLWSEVNYILLGTNRNVLDVAPVFVSLVRNNASVESTVPSHLNMFAELEKSLISHTFPLPCVSKFSKDTCDFLVYQSSAGIEYELQLTYAPSTPYERVVKLEYFVVNATLDMKFHPAQETPIGVAGLHIDLGTVSIRPLAPLNITYFAFMWMWIESPQGTSAYLEVDHFYEFIHVESSNNTNEFTYHIGTRLSQPQHCLYEIQMTQDLLMNAPSVTVEMTNEVDHAEFLVGASPKYMQTVDVGQRIPLRVKTMSALGVPVPYRRVIVVPMLCGEDATNNPPWGPMTRCAEYTNLFADESILVEPSSCFNVSAYVSLTTDDPDENTNPVIPDDFGVAKFDDYAISSGRNGTYVLVAFVGSVPKGTSLPFQLRNLVHSIHVTGFPESMESQSTKDFSNEPIVVTVTDPQGNPLLGKAVFFRLELEECGDFSNLCIVHPVLIIEGSVRTDVEGKLHIKKLTLSGGSIGDYSVWAVVSGIQSSKMSFKVESKDSIHTSDLDLFKYMVIFLFVILIPEMLGNSYGTRKYFVFLGLAASGLTCVASIVLNFGPVFHPNTHLLRTSYLGLVLVDLSVLLWMLIFLAFAVLAVFILLRKEKSVLFSAQRERESKEYVNALLFKRKHSENHSAQELELFSDPNQQLYRRLLDDATADGEKEMVVVCEDDAIVSRPVLDAKASKAPTHKRMIHIPQKMHTSFWLSMLFVIVAALVLSALLLWVIFYVEAAFTIYYNVTYLSMASKKLTSANENPLVEPGSYESLVTQLLGSLNEPKYFHGKTGSKSTVDDTFSSERNTPLVQDMLQLFFLRSDDPKSFFEDLKVAIIVSLVVACAVALLFVVVCWVLMFRLYQKRMDRARGGDFFIVFRHNFSIVRAVSYVGVQTSATIMGFALVFLLVFLFVFLMCWERPRTWIITLMAALIVSFVIGWMLMRGMMRYLRRNVVPSSKIVRRKEFAVWDVFFLTVGAAAGILVALKNFVVDFGKFVLFSVRTDLARREEINAHKDERFASYVGMFLADCYFNNPIFVYFTGILLEELSNTESLPTESSTPIKPDSDGDDDGDGDGDNGFDGEEEKGKEVDQIVSDCSMRDFSTRKKVRNRFWLWWILTKNPSLIAMRHKQG
eukprot:TRINITY_DN1311_c0_g2_i1.p1 TRINITY_DN1311_c0_g2~~TRINITY_DN1311_c0_g2_i1.p1  ORF type:complete len:1306 (+),score=288.14 TRINITY_DN1311_c0_g2_i1:266-3919(+)